MTERSTRRRSPWPIRLPTSLCDVMGFAARKFPESHRHFRADDGERKSRLSNARGRPSPGLSAATPLASKRDAQRLACHGEHRPRQALQGPTIAISTLRSPTVRGPKMRGSKMGPGQSRRGRGLGVFCLVGLALALPARAPDAVAAEPPETFSLRPAFERGQTARFEIATTRSIQTRMSFGDREHEANVTIELRAEIAWEVVRVNRDGGARCRMEADWLTATIRTAEGPPQRVDTRKGPGDNAALHRRLKAMTDTPLTVEVDPDGAIASVSGVERIHRRAGDMPDMPEEIDFIETASELATLWDAPAQARAGTSWRTEHTWRREAGELEQTLTWTVAGVELIEGIPVATVTVEGDARLTPDQPPGGRQGPAVNVRQTRGEYEGRVMFDLSRHEVVGRYARESRQREASSNMPDGRTLRSITQETIETQVLRIAEGGE